MAPVEVLITTIDPVGFRIIGDGVGVPLKQILISESFIKNGLGSGFESCVDVIAAVINECRGEAAGYSPRLGEITDYL